LPPSTGSGFRIGRKTVASARSPQNIGWIAKVATNAGRLPAQLRFHSGQTSEDHVVRHELAPFPHAEALSERLLTSRPKCSELPVE